MLKFAMVEEPSTVLDSNSEIETEILGLFKEIKIISWSLSDNRFQLSSKNLIFIFSNFRLKLYILIGFVSDYCLSVHYLNNKFINELRF